MLVICPRTLTVRDHPQHQLLLLSEFLQVLFNDADLHISEMDSHKPGLSLQPGGNLTRLLMKLQA